MRVIFACGGTGGHVTPAIAIAERLKECRPEVEILFIGREGGSENIPITNAGFALETIKIAGLKRKISVENLKRIFLAMIALQKAGKIIRAFEPDVIVGTGGYTAWPIITSGCRHKTPTVLHESNIMPGLVTRLCASKCSLLLLNHEETLKHLKGRPNALEIGNPLRSDFLKIDREKSRSDLGLGARDVLIVSFGGSGGADVFNKAMIEYVTTRQMTYPRVRFIHATGRAYFEEYRKEALLLRKKGHKILPYIDNMPTVLHAADIVICRAGALTLSEISLAGVASIIIPSPNVTDDHQRKNAEHLKNYDAAIVIPEDDLKEGKLNQALDALIKDEAMRKKYSKCIEKFAIRDASDKAVNEIIKLAKHSK